MTSKETINRLCEDRDIPTLPNGRRTFQLLADDGWVGQDADLETSLEEYGLIWRDDGDEVKFIYPLGDGKYDWGNFCKDLVPAREWNWANLDSVARENDLTLEEWNKLPLERKVSDMVWSYGTESIFGSCYGGGFYLGPTPEEKDLADELMNDL